MVMLETFIRVTKKSFATNENIFYYRHDGNKKMLTWLFLQQR